MSPWSDPSGRRRIALHEPATSTATPTESSSPAVVSLCGIATRAPILATIFLVITFAVLLANLIVDLIIVFVDPRTRTREATR